MKNNSPLLTSLPLNSFTYYTKVSILNYLEPKWEDFLGRVGRLQSCYDVTQSSANITQMILILRYQHPCSYMWFGFYMRQDPVNATFWFVWNEYIYILYTYSCKGKYFISSVYHIDAAICNFFLRMLWITKLEKWSYNISLQIPASSF